MHPFNSGDSTIDLTPGSFSSIGLYTRAQQLADVEASGGATAKSNVESYFATLDALADTGDAIYTGQENVAIAHYSLIENCNMVALVMTQLLVTMEIIELLVVEEMTP